MIEDYRFGSITIDGQKYNHDIEICFDSRVLGWQRNASHFIDIEDIERVFDEKPEIIIIGTGASGVAEVSEKVKEEAEKRRIRLIIKPTPEAVEILNGIKGKKAAGFFHLTC